jgi:lytic murein transglycosylase
MEHSRVYRPTAAAAVAAIFLFTASSGASATGCQTGNFDGWLDGFKREATVHGVSGAAVSAALNDITYDPHVIALDRNQKAFTLSFEEFSAQRITASRLRKGSDKLKQYGSLFDRIERQFGVPGPVLVAIWGLETDYGVNNGSTPTFRALATLAYDCRRSDLFQAQLLDALRIVERGDLKPSEMRGAWAGEIGQTQLMPSSYIKFAVDFDADGRRDLIHSVADAMASTANYLQSNGWKRGEPYGPGTDNFAALQQWNKSEIYCRTIAYFADRLDKEP